LVLQGKDIEEQGLAFLDQAKREGSSWVAQNVMEYLNHHKERVLRNEIAPGTLKNMYRHLSKLSATLTQKLATLYLGNEF
jgi:hypothetical protein